MAGSKNKSEARHADLVVKKDGSDNPVDACRGWVDPCEYCDKRFGEWMPVDEDIYNKIPERPGFFMIALKNKTTTEVVSILYNETNLQKDAIAQMDKIQEQISNKKVKATKSSMLVRWMVLKKLKDKDSVILCCHWNNNGVLPKFTTSWPGQNLMEEAGEMVFLSKQIQKWCYKSKDPVWRKSKPPPSKSIEEVKKCNFQSCETCDRFFTPWQSLEKVIGEGIAPEAGGLVMLSLVCGKEREIVLISNDPKNVVVPIRATLAYYEKNEKMYVRNSKFNNRNPALQVRWTVMQDIDSDNSCLLFAHFHNADEWPQNNAYRRDLKELGELALNKNKHFVFRTSASKWFYETEALKPTAKSGKAKSRRELLDELLNGDVEVDESELS